MELTEKSGIVKIITYSEFSDSGGRSLVLDHSKLRGILQGVSDVPVAIVCVTSRENPGITDLLRMCFTTNVTKLESKVNNHTIWMDKYLEDKQPGIWINTDPFMSEVNGENIGILFLVARGRPADTNTENEEQWSQILGLSLLISSHVILPCSKFIQEALLSTLKNNCPNIENVVGDTAVFQNLIFLTYDWAITVKHEHGSQGGLEMLQSKLEIQERQSDLAKKIRETIKKSFESLRCFLLPNSGQFFKEGKAVYDPQFAELMNRFILENLDVQMMHPKKLYNKEDLLGNNICDFIQICIDYKNNKISVPLHELILEISSHEQLKSYSTNVRKELVSKSVEEFEGQEVLDVHEHLKEKAIDTFSSVSEEESVICTPHEKIEEKLHSPEENATIERERENFEIFSQRYDKSMDDLLAKNNLILNPEDIQRFSAQVISELKDSEENLEVDEASLTNMESSYLEQHFLEKKRIILDELSDQILASAPESEFPVTIEEADELAKRSKEAALERYEIETNQLGIDNVVLLAEFRKKLEGRVDEFYNGIKQHLEKKNGTAGANESVEEILLWAKNKMPASTEFLSDEEIKKVHQKVLAASIKTLKDSNSTLSSVSFNELLEELNRKMDDLKLEILSEFQTIEKGYRTVCNTSFALYEEKMTEFLKGSEFVKDEIFEERNNLFSEAENYFENFPHNKESKPLYQEYHDRLLKKLKSSAEEYLQKNAANRKRALENIESRKALCMAQYDSKLKNAFRTTSGEADLLKLHEKTKQEVEEAFRCYNSERDPEIWQKELEELSQGIQVSYESILDYCILKWTQQSRIFETSLNKATGFYHEQMRANIFETRFIDPSELKEMHRKATNIAIKKCLEIFKSPPLNETQKENIAEALEIAFQMYENRNLMNLPKDPAIGIDLGTTYSCVAVFNKIKGVVEVITNRNSGLKITPSYVAYKNGIATVGEAAKEQAPDNPENTVFDAKRMIGRRFDDTTLQNDMKLWPFKVVEENESPKIEISGQSYFPEQISAKVLQEMKRIAEEYLGCKVEKAVVTVPAYFNDGQRQATIDAGDIAGLKVLKIINEPTAAAIAYKIEHSDSAKRNVLIYDLGGGTFDVAILECVQSKIDVLVVDGDTHLGGVDFDARMSDYCCQEFKKQTGIDLLEGRDSTNANTRASASRILTRLKYACERCKKILSTKPSGEDLIRIDSVVNGIDLHIPVTKELFESINEDLFQKTIFIVNRAIETAKMKPADIDDIVLIGGSTRIPKVQELLSEHFGGNALTFKIHPDEAVAVGAAFQAAMTNGHITKESHFYHETTDVTPFSIGVEVYSKEMSVLIPKNTKVPHKCKQLYRTVEDNQTLVTVAVFQGEQKLAAENMPLGKFDLNGIPKAKKGKQTIEVEIEIDQQGVLHVTAKCTSTGHAKTGLSIMGQKWRISKDVIRKIKVRDSVMQKLQH